MTSKITIAAISKSVHEDFNSNLSASSHNWLLTTLLNASGSTECEKDIGLGEGYCQTGASVPKKLGVKAIRAGRGKTGQSR